MKKNLFYVLVLLSLLMDPMVLTRCVWDHSSILEYIVGTIFLVIVALQIRGKTKHSKPIIVYVSVLIVYYLIDIVIFEGIGVVNSNTLGVYIQDFFALLYLLITIRAYEKGNLIKYLPVWFTFLTFICVITIVCAVVYNAGGGFLFMRSEVMGYKVDQIPFICMMHYNNAFGYVRPSWLFAEPSYLGFFLGFQLLIYFKYAWGYKKRKYLYIAIYILALFATNSVTGFVCVAASVIYYIFSRFVKTPKFLLFLAVPLFIGAYNAFDRTEVMDDERVSGSSLETRQLRMAWALNELSNMDTERLLFGNGRGYVESQHEKGVSNVYLQFLIANGLIFVIMLCFLIYIILKRADYEFFFAVLAFNSTEIALKPITLLIFIIAYSYYLVNLKTSKSKVVIS